MVETRARGQYAEETERTGMEKERLPGLSVVSFTGQPQTLLCTYWPYWPGSKCLLYDSLKKGNFIVSFFNIDTIHLRQSLDVISQSIFASGTITPT